MKKKSHIKSIFTDHYLVKLFSLCCAMVLWFYVVIDNSYEYTFSDVRIHVVHLSKDHVITSPLPEAVSVRVVGPGDALLKELFEKKMVVELDMRDVTESTRIDLNLSMLKRMPMDNGFRPLRIEYDKPVDIVLDRFARKKIAVVSNLEIQARAGFIQVGKVVLEPDSVVIGGPQTQVASIGSIRTEQKVYRNLVRDLQGRVALVDTLDAGVRLSHHEVEFYMDIQRIGERMMTDIPVEVLNTPASVTVQIVPSRLSLKLQGGVDILKDIQSDDIRAVIDYRNRGRYGGRRIPAMITVPDEVTFSNVKPIDFELLIER